VHPSWLLKITMDSASLLTKIPCLDDRYPTLKINISELIFNSYEQIPVAHVTVQCMI